MLPSDAGAGAAAGAVADAAADAAADAGARMAACRAKQIRRAPQSAFKPLFERLQLRTFFATLNILLIFI